MTPGAAAFYGDRLAEVIAAHLDHGYVFSGPGFLCLGRTVPRDADPDLIRDPWHEFPPEQCDAFFLHWIEGDIRTLPRLWPYPLPWICYERRGKMRCVPWETFSP